MDDDISASKIVAFLLILFLIIGGGSLAAWRIGWIFAQKNADLQAHVIRHGYSNQTTLRDQITQNIGNVSTLTVQIIQVANTNPALSSSIQAQRYAIAGIVCRDADQITGDPLPADQAQFVAANCSAGSVNINSSFNPSN